MKNLEPPNLNIPLNKKENWGAVLLIACIVSTGIIATVSPSFAVAFAATWLVGLPIVWLLLFPPHLASDYLRSKIGRALTGALLLLLLVLARGMLIPTVTEFLSRFIP